MNGFFQLLRSLGPARLFMILAAVAGTIAFLRTPIHLSNSPPQRARNERCSIADLDLKDSAQIVQKLEAMSVPYQLRGDGNQILVPGDQVARLRMSMAEQGLPRGGSVGYELFDKTGDGFGPSQFVAQNINQLARPRRRARAHHFLDQPGASTARVHLVLPQRGCSSRAIARKPAARWC